MKEVAAHETQYLLGTESFIDKILASDRSFARGIIDRISALKEAFSKLGDNAAKAQLKMLRRAEKLYLEAARKAGDMQLVKYILSHSPELEKEVDKDAQIVYNERDKERDKKRGKKHTYYSQYYTLAMQWAFSPSTKPGDIKILYNPQNNTWNKLIADDTEERYGTLRSIEDIPENAEIIKALHNEEYENDYYRAEHRSNKGVHQENEGYGRRADDLGDDNRDVKKRETDGSSREIYRGKSDGDRNGNSGKSGRDNGSVRLNVFDDTLRFKLSEKSEQKKYSYELTGNKVKKLANATGLKVYSKAEAEEIINHVLENYVVFGDAYGTLSGKSEAEAVDMLLRDYAKKRNRQGQNSLPVSFHNRITSATNFSVT